ncbi:hypothetical protein SRHO_G00345710 [Serrasalmus rhombeus]
MDQTWLETAGPKGLAATQIKIATTTSNAQRDNATLTRFFAFHFLLPFAIVAATALHALFLHETGSNNPTGLNSDADKISFHPYFSYKDLLGFAILLVALTSLALFSPNLLGDPENFTPANPLVTPPHIKPE